MSIPAGFHGRRGLYWTDDGFVIERDESYPSLTAWIVAGPGIGEPEVVIGMAGVRRAVDNARRICSGCD